MRVNGSLGQIRRGIPRAFCGLAAAFAGISVFSQEATFSPGLNQGLTPGVLKPETGIRWDRFEFHGGVGASAAYDDFVAVSATGKAESDYSYTLSPYGSVDIQGPYDSLRISYQPSFLFFADHSENNNINHSGNLIFDYPLNRLRLTLQENAYVYSALVRDIGNRATQQTYSTILNATYDLSYRTSLQGSATYDRYDYGGTFISSAQWGEQIFADYHFTPRISLGVGVGVSETEVQNAATQIGESPQVRVNYTPKPQLMLEAAVGMEFRQFGGGAQGSSQPTLKLTGSYTMRKETVFSIEAQRSQYASGLYAGQNFVNTSFTATLRQQFAKRFAANFTGGYIAADYVAAVSGVQAQRVDSYYFIRSDINILLNGRWSSGIFFQHTANDSNAGTFTYQQNIVGFQVGWGF